MKTIIVPLDFSDESLSRLNPALMLATNKELLDKDNQQAKAFNSKIHLLPIRQSNLKSIGKKLHAYSQKVASYIDVHKIPYTVKHLHGNNLTDVTLDYSKLVDNDMISIMTEQEKRASKLLLGNFAHQMINKSFRTRMITVS
jgi:hypothetical protein